QAALARTTRIKRDAIGQILALALPSGETREFAYDPLGRILKANTPKHAIELQYDGFGNVAQETQDGRVIRHEYSGTGQRARRISPTGWIVSWLYAPGGALSRITVEQPLERSYSASFQHDRLGNLVAASYPGGVRLECSYDRAGRLSQQKLT